MLVRLVVALAPSRSSVRLLLCALALVIALPAGNQAFLDELIVRQGRLVYEAADNRVSVEIKGDGFSLQGSGSVSQLFFGPWVSCDFCPVGDPVNPNALLCCSDFVGTVVVDGVTYVANGLNDATQFLLQFSGDPFPAPSADPPGHAKVRVPIAMTGQLTYGTLGNTVTLQFGAVTGEARIEFDPAGELLPDFVTVSQAEYRFRSVHGQP
jgi:hypothetical protein